MQAPLDKLFASVICIPQQLHIDPVSFYRVLTFMPKGPVYRVVRVDVDADRMAYDLEHETPFKVIRSRPERLNIDRKALRFDETFTALHTTFYFEWRFEGVSPAAKETTVNLKVNLSGPLLGVWFFSVAGGGPEKIWKSRFDTTKLHLDELLHA